MIKRNTPIGAGFVRAPEFDHLTTVNPGWEVWRTPEGVLVTLPPGCCEVGIKIVHGSRGDTTAVVEPPGVHSLWPSGMKAAAA